MEHGIIDEQRESTHYYKGKDKVAGTYTDIYLADDYCEYQRSNGGQLTDEDEEECVSSLLLTKDTWKSPSDYLIGLLASAPPFTSKVLRSNAHNGILAIGDNVLENERDEFDTELTDLIKENETAWQIVLDHKLKSIQSKVKVLNDQAFSEKTKVFLSEATKFYEKSLQEMEDKLREELQLVLVDVRANVIKYYNMKERNLLKTEKEKLDIVLKSKFDCEVKQIKQYYNLLLMQLLKGHKKIIDQAQIKKNYTLRSFLNQVEAEHVTNTMYILCEERKKCKINKFVMDKRMVTEISDKMNTLKKTQRILDDLANTKDGNVKDWEEKIMKIVQLFLKFIGFSLKLLPEQTTFLLDLEKMVVLQLNEIQKSPLSAYSILIDKDNCFNFEKLEPTQSSCDKKPFEIIGDMRERDESTYYGSSETIPPDVNLPYIRVGKKYVYAKCENFEQVKEFLTLHKCKCRSFQEIEPLKDNVETESDIIDISKATQSITSESIESIIEKLPFEDIHQLKECSDRKCQGLSERSSLSPIDSFLNFTEDNFKKLKLFHETQESIYTTKLINPLDEVYKEVPFAETKERFRNAGTQFSSQESLIQHSCEKCFCNNGRTSAHVNSAATSATGHILDRQKNYDEIMQERKLMITSLIQSHPKLLNILTDESYNLPF